MAGFGRIGGGGSCDVDFTVNGKHISASDPNARPGTTKITVKFPKETDICKKSQGNKIVIDLEQGDCVDIRWN